MKKLIIGLIISAIGLYIAFRKIDLAALSDVFVHINFGWLLLAIGLIIFSVWIRALRWQLILTPIKVIRIAPLFSATMIGYFGNGVLPFRLGELLRAYALKRTEKSISIASSFGTIMVERLLDMIGVTVLMVTLFGLYHVPSWLTKAGILMGIIVLGCITLLFWMSFSHKEWLDRLESLTILKRGMGLKIRKLLHSFIEGLLTLRHARNVAPLIIYSILLWIIYWVITVVSASALYIQLSWIEAGIVLVATTMVISIPSSPGSIGTYHAAAVLIMVDLLGKSMASSQAFAILIHAVGFLPLVLIGFYYLLKHSIHIKDVQKIRLDT